MKKIIPIALRAILVSLTPLYICMNQSASAATYPNTINFSGYTWYVENSGRERWDPGPNYWSNNPQNVWVDTNGWLHLKITYRDGRWYCPEVTTTKTLGYGTYAFYLASRVDTIDKNVVLGLFAYKDDSHEIDIEFSKWRNVNYNNSWFTVQPPPYTQGVTQRSFNVTQSGSYSTHYFTWKPTSVYFESFGGHYPIGKEPAGNIYKSFTSPARVDASGVKAHMNLWIFQSTAPSNAQPIEVVVKSFSYTPLMA